MNETGKKYNFIEITNCNMCNHPTASNKVMGLRLNTSQGLKPKSKTGIAVSVIKCKKCNLIYSNPLPIPNDINDHYGIPPEAYWNNVNYEWNDSYFLEETNKVKSLLPFKSGMKSLDIGAGLGKCMLSLSKAGFDAYGFEPSPAFHEKAISKMNIDSSKLKLGSMEDLEYPANFFDFITFGAVLEHLYNPALSIEKALHWLKPDGIIHIEVPSSKHLPTRMINAFYKLLGTNYVSNISPMHVPFHLYEFDVKSFIEQSKVKDFSIASYEILPCEILNFPTFTHSMLKFIMKHTNTGLQLVIYLRKNKHPQI